MIEVFDTAAARIALDRCKLLCPGCGEPLWPWGHARQRTVRDAGMVRPDRALCTGCGVTHVVLDAALLPRRGYTASVIGQTMVAAALEHGHRHIARELAVPDGTVRGWVRAARRCAGQLRVVGIRTVVTLDSDALPTSVRPDELGCALEHLAAVAVAIGARFGLQHIGLVELSMSPARSH